MNIERTMLITSNTVSNSSFETLGDVFNPLTKSALEVQYYSKKT